ncbi:MAG: arylesterase [Arenicellales bacterium]|jgi:acyl-CoA thioesterase-1
MAVLSCAAAAAAGEHTILVLGDSLSSGHGIDERQGWVNLLRHKLEANGYSYNVVNASVSGDTTQDGLSHLDAALERHHPDIVVVELGGNDGLRAFAIDAIRANLSRILQTVRASGARIVLAGMRMPPNYGPAYTDAFERIYPELAKKFNAALVPFFMQGVALRPDLMQDDDIHPNARGQPLLLANVWPVLQPLLTQ